MEQDFSDLFDFDKTISTPAPDSRASGINRGIRPQSHTPFSPPPLRRRTNHRTSHEMSTYTNQTSLLASGFGGGDLGWDWPEEFRQGGSPGVKRASPTSRRAAPTTTGPSRVRDETTDPILGQKRRSAATDYKTAEPAHKRPKLETKPRAPTTSNSYFTSIVSSPSSINQPIKEEPDVKPVIATAKKTTGPFMVDSDSDDDSDKDEAKPASSSMKASPAVSSRRVSESANLLAQKEAQRLASERLRKEALERKAGCTMSGALPVDAYQYRDSTRRSRHQSNDTRITKKHPQREQVTIDLCSEPEDDIVDTNVQDDDDDDWLKGTEIFGVEGFSDFAGDEIAVAPRKDKGRDRQKGGGPVVRHRRKHEREHEGRLEKRPEGLLGSSLGMTTDDKARTHREHNVKGMELFGTLGETKKAEEGKHSQDRVPNPMLGHAHTSSGGHAESRRHIKLQEENSNRRDDEAHAQQRANQLAAAKAEHERKVRKEQQEQERRDREEQQQQERKDREAQQEQERKVRLAREAAEHKTMEKRRQERLKQQLEEAERRKAEDEKRRAEERRAHQQKLVEEQEAKLRHKAEQQRKYEKSMELQRQEAARAEQQRKRDQDALAHWRMQEKKEEEAARRAALAKKAERQVVQQAGEQKDDETARARQERLRAKQEQNARNQLAEDELELEQPVCRSQAVNRINQLPSRDTPTVSTRGPVSLNSAAGVQRLQAVHSLSAAKPRNDGPVSLTSQAGVQRLREVQALPTWEADTTEPASVHSPAGQAAKRKRVGGGATPASATTSFDSGYGSNMQYPLDHEPTVVASTDSNLETRTPSQPQVEDVRLRSQVGEVVPGDIKIIEWRGADATWSQIGAEYERFAGKIRAEDYLKRRCKLVTEVLKQVVVEPSLLNLVKKGDQAACLELNRAIHGTWPLPAPTTTTGLVRDGKHETVLLDPKFRQKLGEVLPEDIKVYRWRENGANWADIAASYADTTGDPKNYTTLRRRYEFVAEALDAVGMSKDVLDQVAKGNMAAREHLNRAIHGRWPIHAAMHIDTSKPHFLKKLGEITRDDIALLKMRDHGLTWEEVSDQYAGLTGQYKDKGSLRLRYERVTAAIHDHPELDSDLLERLITRDDKAIEQVNRAVHGVWPIPKVPTVPGLASRTGPKTKTSSSFLSGAPSKSSHASWTGTGQKLSRDINEADCKLLKWREQGTSFEDIGEALGERHKSLPSRYDNIKATLEGVYGVDKEMIDAVASGDEDALQSLNYLVCQTLPDLNPAGSTPAAPVGRETSDDVSGPRAGPSNDRRDNTIVASSPAPASRSDGRPHVGGKTLTPKTYQKWFEDFQEERLAREEEEQRAREDSPLQPDDYCHFVYFVHRRELKTGQLNEDGEELSIEDVPWTICGKTYESLTEANTAALKQLARAEDKELGQAINRSPDYTLRKSEDENGLLSSTVEALDEGRTEVQVVRRTRTFGEGVAPVSKEHFIKRTCFTVHEKRVTPPTTIEDAGNGDAEGEDEVQGDLFGETPKVIENIERRIKGVFTLLELANRAAAEHWLELTFHPDSMNLDVRKAQEAEAMREILEQLEVTGEFARFEAEVEGGGTFEVWVEEEKIIGPRNIW